MGRYSFRLGSFTVVFATILIAVFFGIDDQQTTLRQNSIQDSVLFSVINANQTIDKDQPQVIRLKNVMTIMKSIKNDNLYDATNYYFYLYTYSVILGIATILVSTLLLFVVFNNGWRESNVDVKISIGFAFFICSICYFMPKLMNNDQNYKESFKSYYNYKEQLIRGASALTGYYCCDTNSYKICIVADSCYKTVEKNLSLYYDINTDESDRNFILLKERLEK